MENYGIMRHAENYRGRNRLTREGIQNAKRMAKEIKEFIIKKGYRKVIIYHSLQLRTIMTAFALKVELYDFLVEDLIELTFLDENYSTSISEKRIKDISQNKQCFHIFVTHQPNIMFFLAQKGIYENIVPCFFWSNNKVLKP